MISFWKETLLNHFRMTNYLCVPILEVINVLLSKLYNLLQIMLFCGNLIILWKRNPFESIQNVNLPLCTKFGDDKPITSQIIQFAASALYLEKMLQLQQQCCSCSSSTLMNKFRMSNYPCVPSLVIIDELFPELFNLLPLPALYLEKLLQLQQQCCSCSTSTL